MKRLNNQNSVDDMDFLRKLSDPIALDSKASIPSIIHLDSEIAKKLSNDSIGNQELSQSLKLTKKFKPQIEPLVTPP